MQQKRRPQLRILLWRNIIYFIPSFCYLDKKHGFLKPIYVKKLDQPMGNWSAFTSISILLNSKHPIYFIIQYFYKVLNVHKNRVPVAGRETFQTRCHYSTLGNRFSIFNIKNWRALVANLHFEHWNHYWVDSLLFPERYRWVLSTCDHGFLDKSHSRVILLYSLSVSLKSICLIRLINS